MIFIVHVTIKFSGKFLPVRFQKSHLVLYAYKYTVIICKSQKKLTSYEFPTANPEWVEGVNVWPKCSDKHQYTVGRKISDVQPLFQALVLPYTVLNFWGDKVDNFTWDRD